MRVLITGAGGFVGRYLIDAVQQECGPDLEVLATTKYLNRQRATDSAISELDVMDIGSVREVVARFHPTHVIHLAAIAAPRDAELIAESAWALHVYGTLNIANALLELAPDCWLIHVGSGLVYGESAKSGLALDEASLLAPMDVYSTTKAAADLAIGAMTHRGLKALRMRPFNHTGPGQTEAFLVPAFAAQVARIEAGLAPPVMKVGNLDSERDFLDVRDVVRAYALVARNCSNIPSGTIFNVASGIPRKAADILDWFLQNSSAKITVVTDPDRARFSDLPRIVGNAQAIRNALDWKPRFSFDQALQAVLDEFRTTVATQMLGRN